MVWGSFFFLFSGCTRCAASGKPRAVVTMPVLAEVTRAVGGDLVDIFTLLPTNQDALLRKVEKVTVTPFTSSPSLYLFVGGELDSWLVGYFPKYLSEKRKYETRYISSGYGGIPFVWTFPMGARDWADEILKALLEVVFFPEDKEYLVRRADEWKNHYQEIVEDWVNHPLRPLKTYYLFSNAFSYLFSALRTEWKGYITEEWVGVPSVEEEKILEAEAYIREKKKPPVLVVSRYDNKEEVQKVAKRLRAQILELELFPDDWKPGATIEELIRENRRRVEEMNVAPVP
ncbi:MAG: metal ABC transporter substrate-binding protein [bacterium JZ-2024 1]